MVLSLGKNYICSGAPGSTCSADSFEKRSLRIILQKKSVFLRRATVMSCYGAYPWTAMEVLSSEITTRALYQSLALLWIPSVRALFSSARLRLILRETASTSPSPLIYCWEKTITMTPTIVSSGCAGLPQICMYSQSLRLCYTLLYTFYLVFWSMWHIRLFVLGSSSYICRSCASHCFFT